MVVTRLFDAWLQISNTIEGRILRIQKRKTALIKEAFRKGDRNTAGNSESIENMKIMFDDD
jgi:DNA repair protein RAD5